MGSGRLASLEAPTQAMCRRFDAGLPRTYYTAFLIHDRPTRPPTLSPTRRQARHQAAACSTGGCTTAAPHGTTGRALHALDCQARLLAPQTNKIRSHRPGTEKPRRRPFHLQPTNQAGRHKAMDKASTERQAGYRCQHKALLPSPPSPDQQAGLVLWNGTQQTLPCSMGPWLRHGLQRKTWATLPLHDTNHYGSSMRGSPAADTPLVSNHAPLAGGSVRGSVSSLKP